MAENKTQLTDASVAAFIDTLDPDRRADAAALVALFEKVSSEAARMWGPAIIGCGRYRYRYDSGREGEMCRIGFSPRAGKFALYLRADAAAEAEVLARLGNYQTAKSCLYIKRLADVDMGALEELVADGLAHNRAVYPD